MKIEMAFILIMDVSNTLKFNSALSVVKKTVMDVCAGFQ